MSYWERTIYFINNLSKDEVFRPIELKRYVYDNKNLSSSSSYINYLNKAGFIEKVSFGKYIRIKLIPESLTTTKIINYLYNDPLKERNDLLEKIRNNLEN